MIRNTFGATFGGPIKKDRFFYFLAYEGQRKRETIQTTQIVPSDELRQGVIQYVCNPATDPNCVLGTPNPNGFNVISNSAISQTDYIVQLTQAQFAAMDPLAASNGTCPWANGLGQCGVDPNVLPVFQQYPSPNTVPKATCSTTVDSPSRVRSAKAEHVYRPAGLQNHRQWKPQLVPARQPAE